MHWNQEKIFCWNWLNIVKNPDKQKKVKKQAELLGSLSNDNGAPQQGGRQVKSVWKPAEFAIV